MITFGTPFSPSRQITTYSSDDREEGHSSTSSQDQSARFPRPIRSAIRSRETRFMVISLRRVTPALVAEAVDLRPKLHPLSSPPVSHHDREPATSSRESPLCKSIHDCAASLSICPNPRCERIGTPSPLHYAKS